MHVFIYCNLSVLHLDVTKKEYSTEMYIAYTAEGLLKGMTTLNVTQQQNHQIHKDVTWLMDVIQNGSQQTGAT